jgi:hypothetical protein
MENLTFFTYSFVITCVTNAYLYSLFHFKQEFNLNGNLNFSSYLTENPQSLHTNLLMLYTEMMAVCCEHLTKHTNKVFWKYALEYQSSAADDTMTAVS